MSQNGRSPLFWHKLRNRPALQHSASQPKERFTQSFMPVLVHFAVERPGEDTCPITLSAQNSLGGKKGACEYPGFTQITAVTLRGLNPPSLLTSQLLKAKMIPESFSWSLSPWRCTPDSQPQTVPALASAMMIPFHCTPAPRDMI